MIRRDSVAVTEAPLCGACRNFWDAKWGSSFQQKGNIGVWMFASRSGARAMDTEHWGLGRVKTALSAR